jgi:hypothetical protein
MANKPQKPTELIQSKVHLIRKEKVLLDRDLAEMYGVETRVLKQAVRRNKDRFPGDFMFELSDDEFQNLRSQTGTSSWGGTRYAPMAFTEQGVAMLSSVLNSKQAVEVNIQIMRVFVKMRKWAENYAELLTKIEDLETHNDEQDETIDHIYDMLKQLIIQEDSEKPPIGFKTKTD